MTLVDTLDKVEALRLTDLEQTIERGLGTFVEVGEALAEIRESRLYRVEHGTFEAYCRDKWNLSKRHVNRLVEAAGVAELMGPMGPIPNERQARELAPLLPHPAALKRVVTRAIKASPTGTLPTARELHDLAAPELAKTTPPADRVRRRRRTIATQVGNIIGHLRVISEAIQEFDVGAYRATPEELEAVDHQIEALRKFRRSLTRPPVDPDQEPLSNIAGRL